MEKNNLINYLDEFLQNSEYKDSSKNGLQVDSTNNNIKKIWYAVDATSYITDKAIEEEVDMIIVHHGMYWGFEQTMTGITFQRIKKLLDNNICLYASHLPLDANNKVGNNIWIWKDILDCLDIKDYKIEKFGEYEGFNIWYAITFPKSVNIDIVEEILTKKLWLKKNLYNFWSKKEINSISIVSGWGGSIVNEAKEKNYDLYITWEAAHHEIILAKDLKQSIFLWWHRETETFWVKLLAEHIQKKYNIEIVFLDEKY